MPIRLITISKTMAVTSRRQAISIAYYSNLRVQLKLKGLPIANETIVNTLIGNCIGALHK